ncbi:MAG: hypothetical protein U0V72_06910 [Cytophagales bacterium]
MQIKYTPHFLSKIEDIFSQSDYVLRFEKGTFRSGYCVLNDQKVVVVNKFYSLDGKINCLLEILKTLELDNTRMEPKNKQFYEEIRNVQT